MSDLPTVIVSGLFVLAAAVIAYWSTTRAAKITSAATVALEQSHSIIAASQAKADELQVAREAYETANRITGGLLTGLTREVERLNVEVADLRASNRKFEQTARELIDVLHEHDIPIPQIGRYQ